jgi:hypothetical protein
MRIFILIALQILIYSQILAQSLTLSCDSICLNNLKFRNDEALRYFEKELLKSSVRNDTLFLSVYNLYKIGKDEISDKNFLLYLSGSENYNSYVKDMNCKGYLYIDSICIIVKSSDRLDKLNMFECDDSICKFFNYKFEKGHTLPLVVGSKINLVYKVKLKNNDKIKFRRKKK